MKSAHPSRLLLLPIRSRAAQIAVAGLTVTMLCPAALAAIGALDTFSSQDSGGGTGWAAPWSEGGTYDDGLITGLGDCETKAYAVDFNYATRSMSAGYAPATTPEVWAAVYLRPMANTGWQFGFELGTGLGGNSTRGAQIGRMLGDGRYAGGRSNAEGTTFLPTTFTAGTATLLVIRLYKDTPAATTYNRADYLADVDGSDGRANALITIATGINLATRAAPVVDQIRLMSDGQTTNFDYVAIGTTQAEVLDPVPDSALFWGGTGSWDTVTANWEDAGGSAVAWVPLSDAVFPGEGGEIPLSGTIRASSLSFKAPGYQLTGGTLTLSGTAAGIFTAGDTRISSALTDTDAGGAIKSGAGKLTLDGDGSGFTGALTIAEGRVDLNGTLGGSVVLAEHAALGGEGTLGDLSLASTAGTMLAVDASTAGALTVKDLNLDGPVAVVLEGTPPANPSTFTLLNHTGAVTGDVASFQLVQAEGHYLVSDAGGAIRVSLTPAEDIVFTNEATFGEWFSGRGLPADPNFGEPNWNSTDRLFFDGDRVTFTDNAGDGFSGLLAIHGTVAPAAVLFDNAELTYSLAGGSIAGPGRLTKNNTGTLILGSANTFTGGVEINGGVLAVTGDQAADRIPLGSEVTVNSGGTFEFRATNAVPSLDFIVNEGGLVTATGTANNHNHLRNVTLNGGTLATGPEIGSYHGENYQLDGDVLVGGGSLSTLGAHHGISLKGARTFTIGDSVAGSAVDLRVTAELEAPDAGPASLVKAGPGTMLLAPSVNGAPAATSYPNGTLVNEGSLLIDTPDAIPAAGQGTTVAAGAGFGFSAGHFTAAQIEAIAANIAWDPSGTAWLELNTGGRNITVDANLTGPYQVKATGGGTLTLTGNVPGGITDDGITTVIRAGTGAATTIRNVAIVVSPDSANPALRDVRLTFTADGAVDVYASTDLRNWGAPVAAGVTAAGPVIIQDLPPAAKFFVLVSAGQPYPPGP